MSFFLSLLLSASALAAFEIPGFELVYTAPVETKLEAPDLRAPADVWVEMISGAKKTLDFEEMYAVSKSGEPLDRVLVALEAAGARGVKTRFLLEEKMLRASDPATIERLGKVRGLELRIFSFDRLGTDGIMHAKYFVADGRQAYVGSQNFDWRSLKHIHETGLRIWEPAIVRQAEEIFEADWKAAGEQKTAPALSGKQGRERVAAAPAGAKTRAYLVASPPSLLPKGVVPSEDELVRLLGEARQEVRVQLLDYAASYRDKAPYAVIDSALRAAAARGVKVKLMVSHWGTAKPGIHDLKRLSQAPNIEVRIATIPVGSEGRIPFARVAHSKTMSVDGRIAWVGTSNWSGGYLDKLRNLEVVVEDARLAGRLAALHEQLWSSEYAAPVDVSREYPKPDKGTD